MNCQEVMEYMQRQLDCDLNPSEQDLLDMHVESCSTCRTMMQRLQRLTNELSSLPKVHPPVSLVDAIMPKLAEIDQRRQSASIVSIPMKDDDHVSRAARPSRRSRYTNMILGGVVAAGVLLGVGILGLGQDDPLRVADSSSGMLNQDHGDVRSLNLAVGLAASDDVLAYDAATDSELEIASKERIESGRALGILNWPDIEPIDSYVDMDGALGSSSVPGMSDEVGSGTVHVMESSHVPGDVAVAPEESGFAIDMGEIVDQFGVASAYQSPSGAYSAYIENGSVIILGEDSEKIYTSQSFLDAEIYDLVWEHEDRLMFRIKTSETGYAYYIDLSERSEGKL